MTRGTGHGLSQPGLLPVAVVAVACWIWDVSWNATFGSPASMGLPRFLTLVFASLWSLFLLAHHRGSRKLLGLSGGTMGLVLFAILAVGFGPADTDAGAGYLDPGSVLLTLALGLLAVGTLIHLIRQAKEGRRGWGLSAILAGGIVLLWIHILAMEFVGWPNLWRGSEFYLAAGGLFALPLSFLARGLPESWSATRAAVGYFFYSGLAMAILWLLPVGWFGPEVARDAFVLVPVPLLLFFPSLVTDWMGKRRSSWNGFFGEFIPALATGGLFVASLWVIHWTLSGAFVQPGGAAQAITMRMWPASASFSDRAFEYWTLDPGNRRLALGMFSAWGVTSGSAWLGFWLGDRAQGAPGKQNRTENAEPGS